MPHSLPDLRKLSFAQYKKSIPADLYLLTDAICAPYQAEVIAVLFYGSCLHQEPRADALADLFIIVSSYGNLWHNQKWLRGAAYVLPPNVFYQELGLPGKTVRCKYAVLSMEDFEAGCATWFHTYIFGRFAQPAAMVCSRSEAEESRIISALATATQRLLGEGISLMTQDFTGLALWRETLRRSYGTELRPESAAYIESLVERARGYFLSTADAYLQSSPAAIQLMGSNLWRAVNPQPKRLKLRWACRTLLGKCLSLLRLMKAFFTFSNGVDYIVYKLERHTGKPIQVPNRVRKWPLIFLWELGFRLWRQGRFR